MDKKEIEYTVIRNCVNTLGIMCAASETKIIDLLTGYLWDKEEARGIKGISDKFECRCKIVSDERLCECYRCYNS